MHSCEFDKKKTHFDYNFLCILQSHIACMNQIISHYLQVELIVGCVCVL